MTLRRSHLRLLQLEVAIAGGLGSMQRKGVANACRREAIVRVIRGLLAVVLAVALAAPAGAQSAADFPNRPITLVVPFAAGVSADLAIRCAVDLLNDVLLL